MSSLEPSSQARAEWLIQTDRLTQRRDQEDATLVAVPEREVYFIEDLATLFGTSRRTIDRRRKGGTFPIPELPAIDNKPRWSKEAVTRFLSESSETKPRKRPFSGIRTGRR